jgi:hypothetical protein
MKDPTQPVGQSNPCACLVVIAYYVTTRQKERKKKTHMQTDKQTDTKGKNVQNVNASSAAWHINSKEKTSSAQPITTIQCIGRNDYKLAIFIVIMLRTIPPEVLLLFA